MVIKCGNEIYFIEFLVPFIQIIIIMAEIPKTYEELLEKYLQLLAKVTPTEGEAKKDEEEVDTLLPPVAPSPSPSTTQPIEGDFSTFGVHPLLIEPILRHLGPFIDHSSLLSCRQACTKWYIFLTPAFLKKSKLVVKFAKERNHEEDPHFLSSSDEDEDELEGWRCMKHFLQVYPISLKVSQSAENSSGEVKKETFQDLRAFYWESRAQPEVFREERALYLESIASGPTQILPNHDNHPALESHTSLRLRSVTDISATPIAESDTPIPTRFDLGFELDDKQLFIPSPPVPESLELVGNTCPENWLKTYGYLVKTLQFDFGNFQRRDRFGEVESAFVVKLLKDYCPKVEVLRALKPNYSLEQARPVLGPLQEQATPQPEPNNLMKTARFETISTLEVLTYRSDKVQCVKELLASTINVKHLTLSMYSIPPESETQYIEALIQADYLKNIQTLKFPMGIKSTTLVQLVGVEFLSLKELVMGRIRQTRWQRDIANPRGQVVPFVDQGELSVFLQNISGTLQKLEIVVNLTHPDEIWVALTSADIPIMPYLRKLDYKYVRPEFTECFGFLDNLPALSEINLTAETMNSELVGKKLLDTYFGINENMTSFITNNFPIDFSLVVKIVRCFPRLKVLHILLPLASNELGNANVRRPFSRFLFKLRKLSYLEELRIKCSIVEKDDFSYSVGFCFRYMRTLRKFSFQSMKTLPRLTPFAVDMGFLKANSLISVELENFLIYTEDRPQIESSLKKKLLFTKFINCFVANPLKDDSIVRKESSFEENYFSLDQQIITTGGLEKWSYRLDKYSDFESLVNNQLESTDHRTISALTFSASDTETLEFAVASL